MKFLSEKNHANGGVNIAVHFLGSHPMMFRVPILDKSSPFKSPSQVLRLKYDPVTKGKTSIVSVFSDNGDVIMFSSAAAHWNSKLLIGSVIERLVYCEIITPYEAKVIDDRWKV